MKTRVALVVLALLSIRPFAFTQETASSTSGSSAYGFSSVPRLIRFSGVAIDADRKPLTSTTGITFLLYKDPEGGAPLWMETQNVQPDKAGHYSVMLGSTSSSGLPVTLFASGEARWLGVQPQGQAEQPRVLLLSVPYALKALDAENLGGKPASSFIVAPVSGAGSGASSGSSGPLPPLAGTGTPNHITKWLTTTSLGDSGIFETAAAKVGIGTITPAVKLDVNGLMDIRKTLTLFPSGATNTLAISGTAFKISNAGAVTFIAGQSFPGTGTVTSVGSGAGLTGGPITTSGTLSIANAGVTNAMLQHSSLTVTANSPLTGGGAVSLGGSTSLGLTSSCSSGQILKWNGSTWACAADNNSGGTVTSVGSGLGLTGGPITRSGTLAINTSVVPQLGANNSFTGNQTISGTLGVGGTSSFGSDLSSGGTITAATNVTTPALDRILVGDFALRSGQNVFELRQFFKGSSGTFMYVGDPGCGSGFAGIGFNGLSGCSDYSMIGDGINTYINRPSGGFVSFRENNGEEMLLNAGGGLAVTTSVVNDAVRGTSFVASGDGVYGEAQTGSNPYAVWGLNLSGNGWGVVSSGPALVTSDLTVQGAIFAGTKDFKIDHPLDPTNKYLVHASVESSEMMNIYTGNVSLDAGGEATVQLSDWFEVLNTDFRYQLTAIGVAAPNLHIAREISGHEFGIAGGAPGMRVSWQITGVRHDAFAKAHPLVVEEAKPANERGYYMHPQLYGQPEEKGIPWGADPEKLRQMKERRANRMESASQRTSDPSPHPVVRASRPPILQVRPTIASTKKQ